MLNRDKPHAIIKGMIHRRTIRATLRAVRILLLLGLIGLASTAMVTRAAVPTIVVLEAKGIINPVMADYISRGIEEAEEIGATTCIIQMDTPGGLDTAMRDIVQDIVNVDVPLDTEGSVLGCAELLRDVGVPQE